MLADSSRNERVASVIQRGLSELIPGLKDPRLGMVTVQEVRVNPNMSLATVFYTVLTGDEKETAKVLKNAAGHLHFELARRIKLRVTPDLKFVLDTSLTYGNRLESLIEQAVQSDNPGEASDGEKASQI